MVGDVVVVWWRLWWLGRASRVSEEFPYLLRKLEYWGTTFNNASLTTKAAQLRHPSPERNVSARYVSGFAKSPINNVNSHRIGFLLALSVSGEPGKNFLSDFRDATASYRRSFQRSRIRRLNAH